MDETKPSRTSDIPAIMRALHQTIDDEPKILADPIAPKLVELAALDADWLAPMLGHPFAAQWRTGFVIRSRYAVTTAALKSAEVGEPWLSRFYPEELASQLHCMGFSEVLHLTQEQAHERYAKNRHDGLAGRRGEQLMRAIV